jgi:hypothetical protein
VEREAGSGKRLVNQTRRLAQMRRKLLISLAALSLIGCVEPDLEKPTDWTSLALPGKTLVLEDPNAIEEFSFNADATVNATFGRKGGPIAGPILYWRVNGNRLEISNSPDSDSVEELSEPSIQGRKIWVKNKLQQRVAFNISNS